MDRAEIKNRKEEKKWLETPLQTLLGLAPATYKNVLENLQIDNGNMQANMG